MWVLKRRGRVSTVERFRNSQSGSPRSMLESMSRTLGRSNSAAGRRNSHGTKPTRFLAAAFLVALLAGCGDKPQAQTSAAPPPPAVGVRAAEMKGVARCLCVRRSHQSHRYGAAARAGRGLPREGALHGRPGCQIRRPALSDRENAVPGGRRPGQGQSRRGRGTRAQRAIDVQSQL